MRLGGCDVRAPRPSLRPVGAGDADGLLALWRETWTATYREALGPDGLAAMLADLDREGLSGMIAPGDARACCAVSQDRIVGSVVFAERGGVAYLWGLYVRPDHQRSGLGRRLLLWAAARVEKAETLEIRVLATSAGALGFYRKEGFREVGGEDTVLPGGVRAPTLVMAAAVASLKTRAAEGPG